MHERTPCSHRRFLILWGLLLAMLAAPARAAAASPEPPPEAGLSKAVNVLYLYYRSSDRRFTEALGLYWHRQKGDSSTRLVLPVYLDFQNRARGERLTLVPPFSYSHDREQFRLRLLPLASFTRGTTRQPRWQLDLWPALFLGQRGKAHFQILVPAFVHLWRPAEKQRIVWAAPFYWERRPGRQREAFVPLFYRDVRNVFGGQRRAFHTPLAGTAQAPGFRSLHVGPVYHSKRLEPTADPRHRGGFDVTTTDALFPLGLLWRTRAADGERRTTLITVPLLRVHSDRFQRSVMFAPLFFHGHERPQRQGERVERHHTVVFPLIWDYRRKEGRRTVAFPLVWHFRKHGASTTVVGNTYVHRRPADGSYNVHVIPFVHVRRKPPAGPVVATAAPRPRLDLKWSVFGGLVGYERAGQARQLRLFFLPISLPRSRTPGETGGLAQRKSDLRPAGKRVSGTWRKQALPL